VTFASERPEEASGRPLLEIPQLEVDSFGPRTSEQSLETRTRLKNRKILDLRSIVVKVGDGTGVVEVRIVHDPQPSILAELVDMRIVPPDQWSHRLAERGVERVGFEVGDAPDIGTNQTIFALGTDDFSNGLGRRRQGGLAARTQQCRWHHRHQEHRSHAVRRQIHETAKYAPSNPPIKS
jgi:hypothetical protein